MMTVISDTTTRAIIAVSSNLIRYFFFAGLAYLLFYVWKRKEWYYLKIQKKFPANSQLFREILYSLITILIFGVIAFIIVLLKAKGYTLIYHDIHDYSISYWFFSLGILIFFHDTWFYWTHRWMHSSPRIFALFHKVHHQSHNPTPWTAFAFHPLEAVVEALFFPMAAFLFPLHIGTIALFLLWMILFNVLGHTGYEIFPMKYHKSWLGKLQNTPTHHNMHHQYAKGNYSLYFNVWDKWMNTNFENYESEYERNSKPLRDTDKKIIHNIINA